MVSNLSVENRSKRELFCLEICRLSQFAEAVQASKPWGFVSKHIKAFFQKPVFTNVSLTSEMTGYDDQNNMTPTQYEHAVASRFRSRGYP